MRKEGKEEGKNEKTVKVPRTFPTCFHIKYPPLTFLYTSLREKLENKYPTFTIWTTEG